MSKAFSKITIIFIVLLLILPGCTRRNNLQQQIENIETFTRLYGYVRFFYPGDGAAKINWDRFAVYGVQKVREAGNEAELKQVLQELFLPMAPGIIIDSPGKEFSIQAITPADTTGMKPVSWQHQGFGNGSVNPIYESIRLNRKSFLVPKLGAGNITQNTDATPFRGKKIRFQARGKVVGDNHNGTGHLWLRVDGPARASRFFDNMQNNPITSSKWNNYQIIGDVADDGEKIYFGCLLRGSGDLRADNFKLEVKDDNNKWQIIEIKNPGFEKDKIGAAPQDWSSWKQGYQVAVKESDKKGEGKHLSIESKKILAKEKLFDRRAKFGEYFRKEIGSGISCMVPLALYGNQDTTYPLVDKVVYNTFLNDMNNSIPEILTGDDLNVRLAGIVISWNVFNHFFPYWDIVKTDWSASLKEGLISSFHDKDRFEYFKTLKKLTAGLKDGHVWVSMMGESPKNSTPPLDWDWVEDQLVITDNFAPSTLDVKAGDVVLEIDGVKAKLALEHKEEYISAATFGWKRYRGLGSLLMGPQGSIMRLTIVRSNRTLDVEVKRTLLSAEYYRLKSDLRQKTGKLQPGIYYLDIGVTPWKDIQVMLPQLQEAKTIICDLRGYPNGNHKIICYLLKEKDTSTRWMRIPQLIYPDYREVAFKELGWEMPALTPRLTAKVIFIIDGRAISYAESFMGFIEHYKLATIIGQPTAGTNGNINRFQIPGDYTLSFTGMKVVKHDGSQHHGVGITPHIYLERTIQGIKEGRDEFLEAALKLAQR